MRLLSGISHYKTLGILLRIGLFVAAVTFVSILSNSGPTNTSTDDCYDPIYIQNSKINTTFQPCTSLSGITQASTELHGSYLHAAQLAEEQAARAEQEAKEIAAKAVIIKHQRRKVRQIDMKQKVEKVGVLVGIIVVVAGILRVIMV